MIQVGVHYTEPIGRGKGPSLVIVVYPSGFQGSLLVILSVIVFTDIHAGTACEG